MEEEGCDVADACKVRRWTIVSVRRIPDEECTKGERTWPSSAFRSVRI